MVSVTFSLSIVRKSNIMFGWLISFLRVGILVETLLLSSRTQSQKKGYESLTFKMTASAFSADVFQLLVLFQVYFVESFCIGWKLLKQMH